MPSAPCCAARRIFRHSAVRPGEAGVPAAILHLRHGIPSHDTFSRVFRLLEWMQFQACFLRFMADFAEAAREVIAIDGKTLRRSFDRASGKSPLHLVSAWAAGSRLVLGQVATEEKSNEITAVPKLLEMISLKGAIVTTDALNCQRAIAAQVIAQGGDYLLALKGNQGTLHDDVRRFLDDPAHASELTESREVDGGHGRIETREAFVSTKIGWLQEQHRWPGLAAIGKVSRRREVNGSISRETAYYLLSTASRRHGSARSCAPIGASKRPALGAGRDDERGSEPKPQGQWAAELGPATPLGAQCLQARRLQGFDEGETQAGRVERRIPGPPPHPATSGANAIALTGCGFQPAGFAGGARERDLVVVALMTE